MENKCDGVFTTDDAAETPAMPEKLRLAARFERQTTTSRNSTPDCTPDDSQAATGCATAEEQPASAAPMDAFDPLNLRISTDYARAINAQASSKAFEARRPNDQEFFRTSPQKDHHLVVAAISDKQDMSRVYVVSGALLDEVKAKYPRAVRGVELVLTQTLVGSPLLWPVPLAEDRGGKWNSSQRAACDQGKSRWTNMVSGRGQYEITTIDNPKGVDWESFSPFPVILHQALSGRLIDSMDHPLLKKLRGEIE